MKVGIIDLKQCNVQSIINSVNKLDYEYILVTGKKELSKSDCIIFPGVGSYDETISRLIDKDLFNPIKEELNNKSLPFLGICIGMQILFDGSEEGEMKGLGIFEGSCTKLEKSNIGWSKLSWNKSDILSQNSPSDNFYFIHNYYMQTNKILNDHSCIAHNKNILSSISCGNIHGVQFHPEKSYYAGQKIFKEFLRSMK